ncbi:Peroxin 13, N-terminal region-domain-containing protein [Mycena rebaudengoi]|nr:Peroxin 13, N-terminal region-domain-containing protein [Mycena rebaudengoi]
MVSPPKPWERNGGAAVAAAAASSAPSMPSSASPPTTTTTTTQPQPPTMPERPASFGAVSSPYGASPYGAAAMSPYSRLGAGYGGVGVGGAYGGGYGGYGSSYGGYGGYSGGYGGMGMGMGMSPYGMSPYGGMGGMGMNGMNGMGMPVGMNGEPSLTQTLESTTQHTFALLHSIVQTFGGVAQMLESTFMATHSSFFAMVGVVDQFGHLRNALGSVLGLFGLMRWMRELITGRPPTSGAMQGEFHSFVNGRPVQSAGPPPPKPSKKPLIIFLLAIFGVPYAMTKLVQLLRERARNNQLPGQLPPLDPASLTFARALFPFTPTNPTELALKVNEVVAVLGKLDPRTGAEVDARVVLDGAGEDAVQWWKGRTREGREGWFPRRWVEVIEKRAAEKKVD